MSGLLKAIVVVLGVFVGAALVISPSLARIGEVWKRAEVKIDNQYITADVVKTESAREKGLGGRTSLGINEGMLFLFSRPEPYEFWMKDMMIPIDLVWIAGGKIVGFEKNMPPPKAGTPDSELPVYVPPGPVDEVLELHAGRIDLLKAKIGDEVSVRPLVPKSPVLQNPQ